MLPGFRVNRRVSTPRSCKASTADVFVSPFSPSGSNLTCQTFWAKDSFHSVSGATNRMGNTPTASELTTTTGRVFRISAPIVGSRPTIQISPRLILIHEVPCLPVLTFGRCLCVMGDHILGLFFHDPASFVQGQPHETELWRDGLGFTVHQFEQEMVCEQYAQDRRQIQQFTLDVVYGIAGAGTPRATISCTMPSARSKPCSTSATSSGWMMSGGSTCNVDGRKSAKMARTPLCPSA